MNAIDKKAAKLARRQRHVEELQKLGYIHKNLNSIRRVESGAHRLAERYANGDITEKELDNGILHFTNQVVRLFGGQAPDNFFINLDPRGYALKIDQGEFYRPLTFTDWGGYGIIAPDAEEL